MTEEAFVESSEPTRRSVKSIKLPTQEDGSIDWDLVSDKHKEAFIGAIKADPNGILQNIQEEAGTSGNGTAEPSGISDATALAAVNILMVVEAIGVTVFGPKFAPILTNLHPVSAIQTCAVSLKELEPVMPECKRIISRYVPDEYLSQEYQDIAIVGKHLVGLSIIKFQACVKVAMEIERIKASGGAASKPNGQVIDAEPKIQ